jgi:MscS family membrane protein
MREILDNTYYNNTLYDWGVSLLIILLSVILAKLVYYVIKRFVKTATAKTSSTLDDLLVDMLEEPIVVFIVLIGTSYALKQLIFPGWLDLWLNKVIFIAVTINFTWLIARLIDAIIREYVVPLTEKTESDFDDQVVPIARKGIRTIIWILGIILALNNAGYDVAALLAGLGLGGLALAMAAKDTVSNIFGGVTIFTDKPFKVYDRIKIDGYDGIVEEVGIRSTRIRTLEGRLITVPNHYFTDNILENVTSEPSRKVILKLGLIYDTTPEQLEKALSILKEIHANDPGLNEKIWLTFDSYGDFSLGITFIYYIIPGNDIPDTQTRINLEVLKQFNAAGLEFAFPTQTIITQKAN